MIYLRRDFQDGHASVFRTTAALVGAKAEDTTAPALASMTRAKFP
jgi:hypothetical protein